MPKHKHILLQTHNAWQLINAQTAGIETRVDVGQRDESLTTVARNVADALESSNRPTRIVLLLESSEVLSDHFRCDARDASNRASLLFQFESQLPYAAEQITADFQPADGGAFGACIVTDHLQPLVDELETANIEVQSISAATLLALQSLIAEQNIEPNSAVVWCDDFATEICVLHHGRLRRWMQSSNDVDSICAALHGLAKRHRHIDSIVIVNAPEGCPAALQDRLSGDLEVHTLTSDSIQDHAISVASRVLVHREEPLFEFRRGSLAQADPIRTIRQPLQWAYYAAAIFLIALTASFWLRATAYDGQVEKLRGQEADLFAQVFPKSNVPAGVLSRLESEHARLAGARGTNRSQKVALPFPALTVLEKFLDSLSIDERIQFAAVRISDGDLEMDADLKTHGSAGVLVAALQQQGFSVVPPTTEKKDARSVNSLVHGSLRGDAEVQP